MSSPGRDNCLLSDVRIDSQDTYEDLEYSSDWSGYRLVYSSKCGYSNGGNDFGGSGGGGFPSGGGGGAGGGRVLGPTGSGFGGGMVKFWRKDKVLYIGEYI